MNHHRQNSDWPRGAAEVFASKYGVFMRAALFLIWAIALLVVVQIIRSLIAEPTVYGQDSHAYWLAAQGELEYKRPAGTLDAYLYSPLFLTAIKPLTWLPWPAFLTVWTFLLVAVAVWLVWPLKWKWAVPLFVCCLPEIMVNNIFLLLALAAVIGMRQPAVWAFPILTKVTMGVGLLWFVARGQWRQFLQGIGATVLIVLVSYVPDPGPWHAWVDFLLTHRDGTKDGSAGFALRCLLAIALVGIGARKNWAWLIAPAMLLASPVLVSIVPAALLVAIPRLAMVTGEGAVPASQPNIQRISDVPSRSNF